ncbi:hypothetical protein SAMN02799641_05738 [Rhodococcus erythropolis]|uniref:hypothetical protein n=1 Tax=Rhodococcus erythropolis TaxID=1833 RepID=UPI000876F9BA|nr:hypothetical protein [Rhodococcus erythropolis]SCZ14117.1 hypothetical protein SAMN02799641_05738 [Rhodococcus erythropolis]
MGTGQNSGIWIPAATAFPIASPRRAFLDVVHKADRATIGEIATLAKAMGLVVRLKVEDEPTAPVVGEPATESEGTK